MRSSILIETLRLCWHTKFSLEKRTWFCDLCREALSTVTTCATPGSEECVMPMPKLFMHLAVLLAVILANRFGEAAQTQPLVLYTDLLSGPNSGGENNHGAYLSIFGKNLGSPSGLGTVTKVFIGGAEVANYRYMGPSMGRSDIQQLTVQIGALGKPAYGVALPIEVQVG